MLQAAIVGTAGLADWLEHAPEYLQFLRPEKRHRANADTDIPRRLHEMMPP